MSKSIVLVAPTAALESRIACRSEPGPLSSVLLTRKVDSRVRSSIHSTRGRSRKIVPLNAAEARFVARGDGLRRGLCWGEPRCSWDRSLRGCSLPAIRLIEMISLTCHVPCRPGTATGPASSIDDKRRRSVHRAGSLRMTVAHERGRGDRPGAAGSSRGATRRRGPGTGSPAARSPDRSCGPRPRRRSAARA